MGHLGLTKIKLLLRSKVFFPNIDKIIPPVLGLCTPYKSITQLHDQHKFLWQPTTSETLLTVNLDFLGSFTNGQYIFVMIDQHIKYSNIEFMRSTSARNVTGALE